MPQHIHSPRIFRVKGIDMKVTGAIEIVPFDPRGFLYRVTRAFWMRNIGSTAVTYSGPGGNEGEFEGEFDLRCRNPGDIVANWWVPNYRYPYSELQLTNLHFLQNRVVMNINVASTWAVDDVTVGVWVETYTSTEAMPLNSTGFFI
jgi:hypothetical protein